MASYANAPVCPHCGMLLEPGMRFCTSCGRSVEEPVKAAPPSIEHECPVCGSPVASGDKFCASCGSKIGTVHVGDAATQPMWVTPVEPAASVKPVTTVRRAAHAGSATSRPSATNRYASQREPFKDDRPRHVDKVLVACGIISAICIVIVATLMIVGPGRRIFSAGNHITSQSDSEKDTSQTQQSNDRKDTAQAQQPEQPAQPQESSVETGTPVQESAPVEAAEQPSSNPSFPNAESSSTLAPDQYTSYYGALNAIDGDTLTAWNEGVDGEGAGEWVRLTASDPQTVNGVRILAGYTKSEDIYYKNNRPRLITVSLSDGYTTQYELADSFGGWQTVDFGGPHRTTYVQVTIDSVYSGSAWNDSSFTEVSPY